MDNADKARATAHKLTGRQYAWRKLLDLPGSHRYFLDEVSGRIGVADRSGATPDRTEDGVLWLDPSRPVHVTFMHCTIPLTRERTGEPSATGDTPASALLVVHTFSLDVVYGDDARAFLDAAARIVYRPATEQRAGLGAAVPYTLCRDCGVLLIDGARLCAKHTAARLVRP